MRGIHLPLIGGREPDLCRGRWPGGGVEAVFADENVIAGLRLVTCLGACANVSNGRALVSELSSGMTAAI